MNNRDQIRFVILIPTPFFVNLWEKLNNSERFPNLYTDSFRPIVILLFPTQKKTTIVGNADEMQKSRKRWSEGILPDLVASLLALGGARRRRAGVVAAHRRRAGAARRRQFQPTVRRRGRRRRRQHPDADVAGAGAYFVLRSFHAIQSQFHRIVRRF